MPLRHEAELDSFLQQLSDPPSPAFHQYLTVEEFTQRFGPSEQDYAAVLRFAEGNGLHVIVTSPNRLVVTVTGRVDQVEKAFEVTMGSYRHPSEDRAFYAADREPIPAGLSAPLWHISGLDNFSLPKPASLKRDSTRGHATGSGPDGSFLGSDLRKAYYPGSSLTGAGQSVGLAEFAGYNIADVNEYFAKAGQQNAVPITGVSTDGSSLHCTGSCDDTEQVLDIEVAVSMAPGLKRLLVYVSDISDVAVLNRMATDNKARSLSCSWGWSPADPSSDDPIFKEFAAQGQTLFVASGDSGAYRQNSQNVYPADDAHIVSVGGTSLTLSPDGAWVSETAWGDSGGGPSPNQIPIPAWQKSVITSLNQGSTVYRNSPDVSAEADTDNYICYDGTCGGDWGGTSFAAPRWAGYLALLLQYAEDVHLPKTALFDPLFYSIGEGARYSTFLHDITTGNNGAYSAHKGYDLVTGWGSPNGNGLISKSLP